MLGILDQQEILPDLASELEKRARKIMAALELDAEVSLVLCDDKEIQSLNLQWRGIDKPTDVLSFPQENYAPAPPFSKPTPASGSDTLSSDASGSNTLSSDASGSDTLGSDASGSDASGSDASGSDTLGLDASSVGAVMFAPPIQWSGDVEEGYREPMEMFPRMLGDIVISVETCVRQAKEWNHTPLDEATRLWTHGLLHLCGYDHQTQEEAAEMRRKEEDLLQIFANDGSIAPLVQTEIQDM